MKFGIKELALIPVFIIITLIATIIFPLYTNLYYNFGDVIIVIASLVFGPIVGGISGGIGSALGEYVLGYTYFVPFTLVVKLIEGFIIGYLVQKQTPYSLENTIKAWIIGGLLGLVGSIIIDITLFGSSQSNLNIEYYLIQLLISGIGIPISSIFNPSLIKTPSPTSSIQIINNSDTTSADRLLKLKELLESGAITKQEFDEQKKKILES